MDEQDEVPTTKPKKTSDTTTLTLRLSTGENAAMDAIVANLKGKVPPQFDLSKSALMRWLARDAMTRPLDEIVQGMTGAERPKATAAPAVEREPSHVDDAISRLVERVGDEVPDLKPLVTRAKVEAMILADIERQTPREILMRILQPTINVLGGLVPANPTQPSPLPATVAREAPEDAKPNKTDSRTEEQVRKDFTGKFPGNTPQRTEHEQILVQESGASLEQVKLLLRAKPSGMTEEQLEVVRSLLREWTKKRK